MAVLPQIPAEVWEKASQKRMRYLKQISNETGLKAGDVVVSQTEVMDMAQEKLEEEISQRERGRMKGHGNRT